MQKKIVFALNSITITRCLTRIGEFVVNWYGGHCKSS